MPKAAGHALHRRRKHGASGDSEMVMVSADDDATYASMVPQHQSSAEMFDIALHGDNMPKQEDPAREMLPAPSPRSSFFNRMLFASPSAPVEKPRKPSAREVALYPDLRLEPPDCSCSLDPATHTTPPFGTAA